MSDPFIAEIRIFAGNFAPRSWAFCDGQLLSIAQNTALFSLVGTTYGGDGKSTFGLPNLQGRAPMHPGQGPGLQNYRLGQSGGSETVTLTAAQMPSHNHALNGTAEAADQTNPASTAVPAKSPAEPYSAAASNLTPMANQALLAAGGNMAHNNMQPYLTLNFIIATFGIYPQRP